MQNVVVYFLGVVAASQAQVTPEEIAQIGKAVYDAIKDNQPVIDVNTDWAGAVPKGVSDWTVLEHWQEPVISEPFYVEFKNFVGKKLTRFEWSFAWKFGGDYNGTGQYVTQAGIQVKDSYAYLSEHLDVEVHSLQPVNYGSDSSPIGGLDIQVSVSSHGMFEKTTKTCTMTVKGDGTSQIGACESGTFHSATAPPAHSTSPPLESSGVTPDEVVQIGKAVYDAIKNNQPVIDVNTDWAGAVPKGVSDWTVLEHWQEPVVTEPFYVEFKNFLFGKLTRFEWSFAWKFGGDYNGTGQYVTQAGIQVKDSYAYLSEHLDVEVHSLQPVNYGSASNPVGGLDIQVSVSSHGTFEKTTKTCTMTVKGDGTSQIGACETGTFHCATEPPAHSTSPPLEFSV